jgi:hypothetical protein
MSGRRSVNFNNCPIDGCCWVYGTKGGRATEKDAKQGLWHHLHYYKVKGSITPEKLAIEKAHAEIHKEMKEAGGKSRSHTHHTLVFSLVLTAAYRIQGIPTGARPEGGQQVAQK